MPENTNKVIQLKDTEGNDVSPVVNVGSIYDKNGQKVDNLLSYVVAGTDVPVPELEDVKTQIQNELNGTMDAATLGGSTKEEIIASVPAYTHPSTIQCTAATEINSLKSSVSNGKTQVANAITGKGVSASGNDTFATLASKIGQIDSVTEIEQEILNASKNYKANESSYNLVSISVPTVYWVISGSSYRGNDTYSLRQPSDYYSDGYNFGFFYDWDDYSEPQIGFRFQWRYSDNKMSYTVTDLTNCSVTPKSVNRINSNTIQITFGMALKDDENYPGLYTYSWAYKSIDQSSKDIVVQISGHHTIYMECEINV